MQRNVGEGRSIAIRQWPMTREVLYLTYTRQDTLLFLEWKNWGGEWKPEIRYPVI